MAAADRASRCQIAADERGRSLRNEQGGVKAKQFPAPSSGSNRPFPAFPHPAAFVAPFGGFGRSRVSRRRPRVRRDGRPIGRVNRWTPSGFGHCQSNSRFSDALEARVEGLKSSGSCEGAAAVRRRHGESPPAWRSRSGQREAPDRDRRKRPKEESPPRRSRSSDTGRS